MPTTKTCTKCNGSGGYYALVSQHDDAKKYCKCTACNGKGVIHQMTEKEEEDYRSNN